MESGQDSVESVPIVIHTGQKALECVKDAMVSLSIAIDSDSNGSDSDSNAFDSV